MLPWGLGVCVHTLMQNCTSYLAIEDASIRLSYVDHSYIEIGDAIFWEKTRSSTQRTCPRRKKRQRLNHFRKTLVMLWSLEAYGSCVMWGIRQPITPLGQIRPKTVGRRPNKWVAERKLWLYQVSGPMDDRGKPRLYQVSGPRGWRANVALRGDLWRRRDGFVCNLHV